MIYFDRIINLIAMFYLTTRFVFIDVDGACVEQPYTVVFGEVGFFFGNFRDLEFVPKLGDGFQSLVLSCEIVYDDGDGHGDYENSRHRTYCSNNPSSCRKEKRKSEINNEVSNGQR